MNSFSNLPLELLLIIFYQIDRQTDLLHCMLVCRSWSNAAQHLIFGNVSFKTLTQAALFIEAITATNELPLGSLMQSLNVHGNFSSEILWDQEKGIFTLLAKHCPNVKRIQAREVSEDFCKRLQEEHQNGHFLLLEQIPECGYIEAYVNAALELSDTLTHLILCDSLERSDGEPLLISCNDFSELSDSLDRFPRLSHLKNRHHTCSRVFAYDEYFQRCPLLKAISYTAFDMDIEREITMELEYYEGYMYEEGNSRMDTVDLSTIQPRPDIGHFTGNFVLYSDESIKYIMYKFSNLKSLTINTKCDKEMIHDIYKYSESLSANTMVDLFKYLLGIPRFDYGNILTTDGELTFMVKLLKEDSAILSANSMIELVYREHSEDCISKVTYLRIRNNTTMENANSEISNNSTISLTFTAKTDMNLPHLKFIENASGFVRHLCLRDFYKKTSMLKKKK